MQEHRNQQKHIVFGQDKNILEWTSYLTSHTPSPVDEEIEALKPIWHESFRSKYPSFTREQLNSLIDLKMAELRILIPIRTEAECSIRDETSKVELFLEHIEQIKEAALAKGLTDPRSKEEFDHANNLLQNWIKNFQPQFKASYGRACLAWYKPEQDPIVPESITICHKINSLADRMADAKLLWDWALRPRPSSLFPSEPTDMRRESRPRNHEVPNPWDRSWMEKFLPARNDG